MIELENHTPFPALVFEKLGYRGKHFDVLAIHGTFRLKTDGTRADLASEQSPLVMADTYWGEPETSSLKFETDLVIAKKRSDIHVIGTAHSPKGEARRNWQASIKLGKVHKTLDLFGPTQWTSSALSWRKSKPEPITQLPLRYEYAYGGAHQWDTHTDPSKRQPPHEDERNPIGLGHYNAWKLNGKQPYPAAQILAPNAAGLLDSLGKVYSVEGFGPISRWWHSRAQYAGTYDSVWQERVWPYLPEDFDFAFYNSAHPDLQYPGYLEGNEPLELTGLLPDSNTRSSSANPEGTVRTALGAYALVVVAEDDTGTLHEHSPRLDTVTIDLDTQLIHHTWRLTLPKSLGTRHIVLGAYTPRDESSAQLQALHFQSASQIAAAPPPPKTSALSKHWLFSAHPTQAQE
jgi:hypothetical protein